MLWFPTISKSVVRDTDNLSTGKWLVRIGVPDTAGIWEEIENAAVEGKSNAVKKSTREVAREICTAGISGISA